ncbi:MAG: ATP-binding protein [Anaerovoracaceae bacterium]|nr:ATP-binding protein [Bacillota bacterium]MDY2670458.1 ATP-binding protein [Anaerovoracaceae bacterium]
MPENKRLEYKEKITNTFLKTVSAFSNYDGGKIIFGIRDDGSISPLSDPEAQKLDIENRINDSISPQPDYSLEITDNGRTITLDVKPGHRKPYMYKSKAYKRNDTATIEADQLELTRLILEGQNIGYEELPARNQDLKFSVLERSLKKKPGIQSLTEDILKSLGLYSSENGYNIAAEILADENSFAGISSVKFGKNISTIRKRMTAEHSSVISEIDEVTAMFETFYIYEEIDGIVRQTKEQIPREAFREALANAVIHRAWDIPAEITVFMFDDRIEITSPGGLVSGLSKDEYLRGGISIPRNRILAEVFLRIGLIEKLGTGILRIKDFYRENLVKPVFDVMDNSIRVILPVISDFSLNEDEKMIYSLLSGSGPLSTGEVAAQVPFGRSKVLSILRDLVERNIISVEGSGRGTKYHI